MRRAIFALAGGLAMIAPATRGAPVENTPVGVWRTFDDDGKETGKVEIFEQGGKLYGRIVGIVDPEKAKGVCFKCTDDRKDKPAMGLEIIRGLKPDGDAWDGGDILDPENGKVYSCSARVEDGGDTLRLRGYIGISLLGRTQTWKRALS
jgi:uncharacterized protein (DUF2147 family)